MSGTIGTKVLAIVGLIVLTSGHTGFATVTSDVWANAAHYDFGSSRTNLSAIEDGIRTAPLKAYGEYEDELITLLRTPGSTHAAKDFACRMLRIVGSKKCVPVVAELLTDQTMGNMARYALQGLPFPQVDEALRSALVQANGTLKAGLISSIAVRADEDAIPLLQPIMADPDATVAAAAISALGHMGTQDALKVLTEARVAEGLKIAILESRLSCADALLAKGFGKKTLATYQDLTAEQYPKAVRVAALIGLSKADPKNSIPSLIRILKGQDTGLQGAAGIALLGMKGDKAAKAVQAEIGSFSPAIQVISIPVLVASGYTAAVPELTQLAASRDESVAVAAIQAVAELGDARQVELLANLIKTGGDVGAAAVNGLSRLKGSGVSEALLKLLPTVDAETRAKLIGRLSDHPCPGLVPALARYAGDPDASVQVAAIKTMGVLAQQQDIPLLVGILLKAAPGRVQATAEWAIQSSCAKVRNEGKRIKPLVDAMAKAGTEEHALLIRCLGRLGGIKALEVIRPGLTDKNEAIQEATARALISWPDSAAIQDLAGLAKNASKDNIKILAFQAYVRLVTLPATVKHQPAKTAKILDEAMALAPRLDDKKLLLSALGDIHDRTALEAAGKYVKDETLKADAELACAKINKSLTPHQR